MENIKPKQLSFSEITDKFLKLEEKKQLLNLKINNVFPWQIVRVKIFTEIITHYMPGNVEQPTEQKFNNLKRILYRLLANAMIYNPFFDFAKSEILMFESGRKYRSKNSYIDIYTHYLHDILKKQGKNITTYETYYNENESFYKRGKKVKHLDFIHFYTSFLSKIKKGNFTDSELKKIKSIRKDLTNEFNLDINVLGIFNSEINKFKIEFSLYDRLLKKKKPKEIFIINSCDRCSLIDAAKQNKIFVNELQHGLNSDKDVILNFPFAKKDSLAYFPDKFYIWDNVDMFFATLPLSEKNILSLPNYHLQQLVDETIDVPKENDHLLFISQPIGSIEIQEFIINNIEKLANYKISYKVHPAENKDNLVKLRNYSDNHLNLRIIDNNESIYVLMKKAKYVIGIYSSALFEAIAFDCKIILLNLSGVEMSFPLLKQSNNKLIEINEDLSVYLND
ncbi:hypothetical protein MQX03_06375 [Chryseobacterium aahli]|uniref:hypothetical protein n=1 Tax=Chryseobacterium aahli TaxID=1278643 RepID=UPI001F5FFF50|nr:hypothetical protein [Chryseobacterium aahli]MCI3936817.1 hypothetical protein [Chryseobacterium aahli]